MKNKIRRRIYLELMGYHETLHIMFEYGATIYGGKTIKRRGRFFLFNEKEELSPGWRNMMPGPGGL